MNIEALKTQKPKRGRKRTPESIKRRLEAIEKRDSQRRCLEATPTCTRKLHLKEELDQSEAKVDLSELEKEFIKAAKPYGERRGISYTAWRAVGVPPSVLREAGIGRST